MSKVKAVLDRIRDLPDDELGQALERTREELFRLRLGNYTNQVENTVSLRFKQRELARILTVQRARELALETQMSGQRPARPAAAEPPEAEPEAPEEEVDEVEEPPRTVAERARAIVSKEKAARAAKPGSGKAAAASAKPAGKPAKKAAAGRDKPGAKSSPKKKSGKE